MKNKQRIFWGIVAGTLVCAQAWAISIPGRTPFKVNDYANVIDPAMKQKLETILNRFEVTNPTKAEIIVSTFRTLDGMPMDRFISSYARKWRRMWPFERDRRVHFIVIVGEGRMRMGVGRPFERDLPPDKVQALLEQEVTPYFQKRQYSDGIAMGVLAVVNALGGIE